MFLFLNLINGQFTSILKLIKRKFVMFCVGKTETTRYTDVTSS